MDADEYDVVIAVVVLVLAIIGYGIITLSGGIL